MPGAAVVAMVDVMLRRRSGYGVGPITLDVGEGEWLSVLGPAGSGKTTLLRILSGEAQADQGEVRVLGGPAVAGGCRVASVAEEIPRAGGLTPRTRVEWRLGRAGCPRLQRAGRIAEALELMDLAECRDRPERELSGCQRTALAIAGALAVRPALLLLDNVTTSLAPDVSQRLFAYLDGRRLAEGASVLHASTASAEAERADRVLLLHRGAPMALDKPQDLMARYAPDVVTIEADNPAEVQRTLRGIFHVRVTETADGLRLEPGDAIATAAHVFRHHAGGARVVHVRRGDLWHVHARLLAAKSDTMGPNHTL